MAVLVFVFVAVVVVVFSFLSRFEKVSEQALVGDKKCTPLFTSATNPPLFFFFFFTFRSVATSPTLRVLTG